MNEWAIFLRILILTAYCSYPDSPRDHNQRQITERIAFTLLPYQPQSPLRVVEPLVSTRKVSQRC